ncbi:MAG: hypothetical protein ACYCWW_08185 [Deltaproteobacteria bacterium]
MVVLIPIRALSLLGGDAFEIELLEREVRFCRHPLAFDPGSLDPDGSHSWRIEITGLRLGDRVAFDASEPRVRASRRGRPLTSPEERAVAREEAREIIEALQAVRGENPAAG